MELLSGVALLNAVASISRERVAVPGLAVPARQCLEPLEITAQELDLDRAHVLLEPRAVPGARDRDDILSLG